ncbi:hypothetical protein CB1_000813014 [Camelus ferus]|nr:hypothetical protein CB1_000813014 [Camelus ferus]
MGECCAGFHLHPFSPPYLNSTSAQSPALSTTHVIYLLKSPGSREPCQSQSSTNEPDGHIVLVPIKPEKDNGKEKEKKDKELSHLYWHAPVSWATMRTLREEEMGE